MRVWEAFHRLERDANSAVAGSGIGLAVVHELVTLHGGRVRVEDAPPPASGGHPGARFVIELPIRRESGIGNRESWNEPAARPLVTLATPGGAHARARSAESIPD